MMRQDTDRQGRPAREGPRPEDGTGGEAVGAEVELLDGAVVPYVLIRQAGLPLQVLDELRFDRSTALADEYLDLEHRCQRVAPSICDSLYNLVGTDPGSNLAAFLVQLKRDIYNDRLPRRPLPDEVWEELRSGLPPEQLHQLQGWLDDQGRRQEILEQGDSILAREVVEKRGCLQRLTADESFRKGLALASRVLFEEVEKYSSADPRTENRHTRKTELGVLRYLLRTSCKTSPFSTFTSTGSGRLEAGDGLATCGPPWQGEPRSVVRLNQALVLHIAELAAAHPTLRRHLPVRVNPNFLDQSGERLVFTRRSSDLAPFKFVQIDEKFTVFRVGKAVESVLRFVSSHPAGVSLGSLETALAESVGDPAKARSFLEELIGVGVLICKVPIPEQEPEGLVILIDFLTRIPEKLAQDLQQQLGKVLRAAEEIESTAAAGRQALLQELKSHLDGVFELLQAKTRYNWTNRLIYEDCVSGNGSARVPYQLWREPLACLEAFYRVAVLFDYHVFHRQTIKHLLSTRWKGGRAPLLSFASQYLELLRQSTAQASPKGPHLFQFNPLELPELEEYARLQDLFTAELVSRLSTDEEEVNLDAEWIESFTRQAPAFASGSRWLTCFCQPFIGSSGRAGLVVNHVFNGPVRALARFLAVSPGVGEAAQIHPDTLGRILTLDGGSTGGIPCEILASFGFNANYHPFLTHKILGYTVDETQGDRLIPLSELDLELEGTELRLRWRRTGESLLPFDGGMLGPIYHPPLFRFLTFLHQSRFQDLKLINRVERASGGARQGKPRKYPRVRSGDCVLARRSWRIPRSCLPKREAGEKPFDYWLRIRRWKRELDLPEEVFIRVRQPFDAPSGDQKSGKPAAAESDRKPQYLDFRNVFLVRLLERDLDLVHQTLTLEEFLPDVEDWRELGYPAVREFVFEMRSKTGAES